MGQNEIQVTSKLILTYIRLIDLQFPLPSNPNNFILFMNN